MTTVKELYLYKVTFLVFRYELKERCTSLIDKDCDVGMIKQKSFYNVAPPSYICALQLQKKYLNRDVNKSFRKSVRLITTS